MSSLLPSDLPIDALLAQRLIYDQFGIATRKIDLLGEGFDNVVFLINEHMVFRFPRRSVSISLIELELRLLPKLAGLLPFSIPEPRFIGTPTDAYEAPFYGHEILAGRSGCGVKLDDRQFEHLALDLAGFLKALHELDYLKLKLNALDLVPLYDRVDRPQMQIWLDERFLAVRDRFDLGRFAPKVEEIKAKSSAYIKRLKPPVLVHGDLYHRHLLFNKHDRLAGVIDWGDSCLSDRVVDLGVVYQFLPPQFHDIFFSIYGQVSSEELDYARFLGLYYIVAMLWFGSDREDQDLISSSLEAIALI